MCHFALPDFVSAFQNAACLGRAVIDARVSSSTDERTAAVKDGHTSKEAGDTHVSAASTPVVGVPVAGSPSSPRRTFLSAVAPPLRNAAGDHRHVQAPTS